MLVLIKRFVCVGHQLLWVKVLVGYAAGHAKAGGDANRAAFKRHMKLLDVRAQSLGQPRRRGAHSGLHEPTVRVASPVLTDKGKVLGLIVINVDLNGLFDRLKSVLPSAYQLYLSNHWGDYLIPPNPTEALALTRDTESLFRSFSNRLRP